jgi:hypothetical protein
LIDNWNLTFRTLPCATCKIKSRWITDLKFHKKILEENKEHFYNLRMGEAFVRKIGNLEVIQRITNLTA